MQTSKIATWTAGILAAGFVTTAASTINAVRTPARAQRAPGGGLTTAELTGLQRMQGEFAYESSLWRPELWKAVENGTRELDPTQARRTRAQLEQLLSPPPHVELALETGAPSTFAIQEGRAKASAPVTGEQLSIVPKGVCPDVQPLQLSQQLQGAALVRVVEGKDFRQERRFSLSADGAVLTLEIRVSGAALQRPLSTRQPTGGCES